MEDDLDEIAAGDEARTTWLQRFYFGDDGDDGLKELVEGPRRDRRARGQHGRDRQRHRRCASASTAPTSSAATERQTLPPDIAPDELTAERAEELLAQGNRAARARRRTRRAAARSPCSTGRYGPYVTEVVEGDEKPRTASLFKSMSPETVTLEDALRLLDAAARRSGRVRTARRCSPRTAATART